MSLANRFLSTTLPGPSLLANYFASFFLLFPFLPLQLSRCGLCSESTSSRITISFSFIGLSSLPPLLARPSCVVGRSSFAGASIFLFSLCSFHLTRRAAQTRNRPISISVAFQHTPRRLVIATKMSDSSDDDRPLAASNGHGEFALDTASQMLPNRLCNWLQYSLHPPSCRALCPGLRFSCLYQLLLLQFYLLLFSSLLTRPLRSFSIRC